MSVPYKPRINIVPHRSQHERIFIERERGIVACRLHLSPPPQLFYPALFHRSSSRIRVSFARFHGETRQRRGGLRIAIITPR